MERAAHEAGVEQVDGVVLDIGVSSMQLDDPARGFSFLRDGPLDMRMSQDGPSAADVVNTADEGDLADILFELGEGAGHARSRARSSRRVAIRRSRPPSGSPTSWSACGAGARR